MIRRPPRSTLFPLHDALPILEYTSNLVRGDLGKSIVMNRPVADLIFEAFPNTLLLTIDRKSTRLNSSHANISYAVFCLKKKNTLISFVLYLRRTPRFSVLSLI